MKIRFSSEAPACSKYPMANEIRRSALDRWHEVLTNLGIPASALTKKNKPCPACGGHDRFSFTDRNGTGSFVCRGLDNLGGDGFALVMHWLGCDFKTALRVVISALDLSSDIEIKRTLASIPRPTKKRNQSATVARLWTEASPIQHDDPAAHYLASRGLNLASYPAALRQHQALPYWAEVNNTPVMIGFYPALLAQITNPTGDPVALQRIYLNYAGHKASPLHPVTGEQMDCKKLLTAYDGAMKGSAIRLYEPESGVLALSEGLETALAVRLGSGLPCWAAISAWGLKNVALPKSNTDVFIMSDNDTSGIGQTAANILARRLTSEARRVRVLIPKRADTDWLDVLNEKNTQGAAS